MWEKNKYTLIRILVLSTYGFHIHFPANELFIVLFRFSGYRYRDTRSKSPELSIALEIEPRRKPTQTNKTER